ncbi:hypothetical protein D3C80_1991990 [compost metagenome]
MRPSATLAAPKYSAKYINISEEMAKIITIGISFFGLLAAAKAAAIIVAKASILYPDKMTESNEAVIARVCLRLKASLRSGCL